MKVGLIVILGLSFTANVMASTAGEVAEFLQKTFADQPKIKISLVADVVVIDGEADHPEQMERIRALTSAFAKIPVHSVSLVRINPKTLEQVAERISREIGSDQISVRFINNTLELTGIAANEYEADRAVNISKNILAYPRFDSRRQPAGKETGPEIAPGPIPDLWISDMMRIKPRPKR